MCGPNLSPVSECGGNVVGKSDPALLIFAIGPVAVNQVKDTEQRGEDKRHNV
jgi:hypothetical protein